MWGCVFWSWGWELQTNVDKLLVHLIIMDFVGPRKIYGLLKCYIFFPYPHILLLSSLSLSRVSLSTQISHSWNTKKQRKGEKYMVVKCLRGIEYSREKERGWVCHAIHGQSPLLFCTFFILSKQRPFPFFIKLFLHL